ncbi:MAG: tRNA (N6-isopentenyl adenosine(37)-C2)-methylthiotransferase MiaB [Arsenophonus sp.]|nr:MAG: tRNA (N6-isopentenyl adenosine(37)-C2)-methylthiotransferase MiaB [Arsenophonus sp.]
MVKKIYIKTWGCQMNEYDSDKIIDILHEYGGYQKTDSYKQADVLILNTCSIRDKAQEKLFHQLGRWKKIKQKNPKVIIAVGGCVASQEGKFLLKRTPYIDIIFGPQTLQRLPFMIEKKKMSNNSVIDISFPAIEKFDNLPKPIANSVSAYVSIMEGCNKYCSFCIVPYTRGPEVSRSCDDILLEIIELTEQGVKEIHLLGQNVNSYYGKSFNGKTCSFSELLYLISSIDKVKRIRFTTSHPFEFTDDIIDAFKHIPKIVSFLHLPVQSGSDRILRLMRRLYTINEYKKIIEKLRIARSNILISSDFIVGFPGETERDFKKTIELVEDICFDMSYSFIYSARPGTAASKLEDNITLETKKERLSILQNKINEKSFFYSKMMLGTIQNVLVEGLSRKNKNKLCARTENNRIVVFDGSFDMIGKFVKLKITGYKLHSLNGELI